MGLFADSDHVAYLAILHALKPKKLRVAAPSPAFFATGAKLLGIDVEFVDVKLDFSSEADVAHNFFETYTPNAMVVFQGAGASVGKAKVFVKKFGGSVAIESEDEELLERVGLFLDGGIKRGRLWNYDIVDIGIEDRGEPYEMPQELIGKQNEIVETFNEAFRKNIYFDTLDVGDKTLKSGYPILLKPSLYCPKEDIYTELKRRGVEVDVRFKPLYKTTLFRGELLPVSEELYKAILILPLEAEIVDPLFEVLGKYRHRGCSF